METAIKGLKAVAKSTDKFANDYFQVLAESRPGYNLITSALGVHTLLAMATYGAAGKNLIEMRKALALPEDHHLGQCGYQTLIQILNNEKSVELRVASKMYTASSFDVKSTFQKITEKKFLAPSEKLDFNDPVNAAEVMNAWCEEQTNGKLTDIVSPGDLPSDTLLILVNAVYFKGRWKQPFPKYSTVKGDFHVDENTTIIVPTMSVRKDFKHGNLPQLDSRFIELLYEGENLSMIIILPNEINGLEKT